MLTRKIALFLGVILIFTFTLSILSRTFDGDFGWHLRFGQETLAGHLPYTDSYTWTYAGQAWTNHEWGGDVLFWVMYHYVGFFWLEVLITACVTTAFVLLPVVFRRRLTLSGLLANGIALWSVDYLISMRQTTMAPLFFVALIFTLEKISLPGVDGQRGRRWLLTWPVLFWLWAALHGSWILGFIVITIYAAGHLGQHVVHRLAPDHFDDSTWNVHTFLDVLQAAAFAFAATVLNPYGLGLWGEIGSYFTQNYFKNYITEWLPSYTFPIYWSFFVLIGTGLVLAVRGLLHRKITIAQFLLLLALMWTGVTARRNSVYSVLVVAPLLAAAFEAIFAACSQFIQKKPLLKEKMYLYSSALVVVLLVFGSIWHGRHIRYLTDPWHDDAFLASRGFPIGAVHALEREPADQKIFNEFHWGGFLNWTLPSSTVYLDGRGTATWMATPTTTLYQAYRALRFDPNGLTKIETTPANYILLQKQFTGYDVAPNFLNRLTFDAVDLALVTSTTTTQLERDLAHSPRWEKMYEDPLSLLFKRRSRS